ncbi:hypothetical protein JCM10908_004804 [Rhodotorula pacifica]|uniref:uncharacterized protein n=1 Tax=Rhodotorula pacifica TaxID=1495444 RepID=UPI00317A9B0A
MSSTSASAPAAAPATTAPSADDTPLAIPNLALPQLAFVLQEPKAQHKREGALDKLIDGITEDEMAPYLEKLVASGVIPTSLPSPSPSTSSASAPSSSSSSTSAPRPSSASDLIASLREKNTAELDRLQTKLVDARTNLGESEVSDALRERAAYLARIGGDKDEALKAYEDAIEKTAGKGTKIDLVLSVARIAMFHDDHELIASTLDRAQKLVDEGGDWDRRNRLKVYRGVHLLSIRNFKKGAELLLDALPTFTASELIDYDDFVVLCVLAGVFALERKDLKKKVIDAPEVIAVVPTVPTIKGFAESLHKSDYAAFFKALATVEEHHLLPSCLLSIHAKYYTRELRIKAYAQLLESYRSVTMENLSAAFGVSSEWLDADLARFIAAGRLTCSIDRVNGTVETHRPDAKNARYAAVIKQGDAVLTSVQRLSRVIG